MLVFFKITYIFIHLGVPCFYVDGLDSAGIVGELLYCQTGHEAKVKNNFDNHSERNNILGLSRSQKYNHACKINQVTLAVPK